MKFVTENYTLDQVKDIIDKDINSGSIIKDATKLSKSRYIIKSINEMLEIVSKIINDMEVDPADIKAANNDMRHNLINMNQVLPYMVLSDKYEDINEFIAAYTLLGNNYVAAISAINASNRDLEAFSKSIDILTNMLESQNNYYRLINMSYDLLEKYEYISNNYASSVDISAKYLRIISKENDNNED